MIGEFGLGVRLRQCLQALHRRIEAGPGHSTPAQRRAAIEGGSIEPLLDEYLQRVRECAVNVTNEGIARLRGAGYSEDELFELTIAAALGAASERLGAGLRALKAAYEESEEPPQCDSAN